MISVCYFCLEETCAVIFNLCIVHHYRNQHLSCVLSHLSIAYLCIILSEECACVATCNLIYIYSDVTLYRTADLSILRCRSCTDEHWVKTLSCH